MSWLSDINRSFDDATSRLSAGNGAIRPAQRLVDACTLVRKRFGSGQSALASNDRLTAIVARLLRDNLSILSRGDRYVLAHTLAQPVPQLRDASILGSGTMADRLLVQWEKEAGKAELRASHWRGLFHSFLQAQPSENTDRLRKLLRKSWSNILAASRHQLPWMTAVQNHLGLLGEHPCDVYVAELIRGDRALLDDLLQAVTIPPASWFWGDMRDALLRLIGAIEETEFKRRIDFALSMGDEIPMAKDAVLAGVLNRYAQCQGRTPHQKLLAYSLEAWKSPQLARNALWSQVRADTKRMICGWLAQEDLEDFYRLCQDAGRVDERRLKFWLRYKEQIVFSQIVLGGELMWSQDPDIRDFLQRKKGRLATLITSSSGNNSIIMQIGEWVFVEFSQTGNACYPYIRDNIPFDLGETRYSLTELKDKTAVERSGASRLVHRESWEKDTFEPFLRARGIYADDNHAPVRRPRRTSETSGAGARGTGEINSEVPTPLTSDLVREIKESGGRVLNGRAMGGYLWVQGSKFSDATFRKLKRLGFKFKLGHGFYLP